MACLHVPAVWLGVKVVQRRFWAVWAGTLFALLVSLANIPFEIGSPRNFFGLFNEQDPGMSFTFRTQMFLMPTAQLLAMVLGLLAYYANRQSLAWSRPSRAVGE
jgi:hypothetical protein